MWGSKNGGSIQIGVWLVIDGQCRITIDWRLRGIGRVGDSFGFVSME